MKRPILFLLGLFVCASLVGALWFVSQADSGDAAQDLVLAGPTGDVERDDADEGALPTPVLGERTGANLVGERDVVDTDEEPEKPVVDIRSAPPKDVIWLEGRVVEPDGLPPGDQIYVVAKGKSFDRRTKRREHEVKVKPDGTFRVALAKGTRVGWLNVRSRFAYMEEGYQVKPRKLEEEIVLEPVLGGVLRGEVVVPTQLAWTKQPLRGGRAELMMWGQGKNTTQYEDLEGGTTFEFLALPPGEFDGDVVSVRTDFLQRGTPADKVEIKPGEVTTVPIELNSGARIFGKLVDDDGKFVPEAKIELSVIIDDNEWGAWRDRQKLTSDDMDKEGNFVFYGVRPGKIKLEASAMGYREFEFEVGEVDEGDQRTGIELVLDRGKSISGHVKWPDGKPAVGAVVKLEQEADDSSWAMWEAIPSVKTDESGDFVITGLTVEGTCRVVASLRPEREEVEATGDAGSKKRRRRPRPHAWRARVDNVQPGASDLRLTLDSGASVSGRVVDDRGEAVTRFHVTATPLDREMSRIDWETRTGTTVLAGDGSFKLNGVQEGKWNLVVAAHGHVNSEPQAFEIPHDGREMVVVCPRASEIRGIVRDPAGDPIVGADVTAQRRVLKLNGDVSEDGFNWIGSARTNSEGEFHLEDLQGGTIALEANHDDYGASPEFELELAAGQELEGVDLRLTTGARLRIELHPAVGEVSGRDVQVTRVDGDYWESFETDAGGSVVAKGLDAGTYRVTLQAPDSLENEHWTLRNAAERSATVEVRQGGSERVVLGTPSATSIRVSGRVTSGGAAVAGAVVSCKASSRTYAARTNEAGEYQFDVEESGTFDFSVDNDGNDVEFRREVPEGESVRFDFELPTMSISGRVTTPDGDPAEGIRLTLQHLPKQGDPEGTVYSTQTTRTDDDGQYSFGSLRAGSYHLRAGSETNWRWRRRGARYAQVVISDVVVEEGKSVAGLDIHLERPGTLRGIVYGPDGEALEGAWVQTLNEDGIGFDGNATSMSGPDGRFRITGLPAGNVKVVARQDDSASSEVVVKVFEGEESEVELRVR